jgi:hypothetical protein
MKNKIAALMLLLFAAVSIQAQVMLGVCLRNDPEWDYWSPNGGTHHQGDMNQCTVWGSWQCTGYKWSTGSSCHYTGSDGCVDYSELVPVYIVNGVCDHTGSDYYGSCTYDWTWYVTNPLLSWYQIAPGCIDVYGGGDGGGIIQ